MQHRRENTLGRSEYEYSVHNFELHIFPYPTVLLHYRDVIVRTRYLFSALDLSSLVGVSYNRPDEILH
ncbi:hypothetical protein LIPSTDRAFT_71491 [Lipomyces starkeyi NRRL Y-11557]|uniref:Uncharacterized protein n=1 Tax=Lipomyces starkeyi NRRL Y-11557 TaxID=675824 RepID=A0A1E3Q7M1_LIPST|nr:hypothetical protein LIPSTDRAFT_71491 [Lipomyces starkeyi NRRL Y-11557]